MSDLFRLEEIRMRAKAATNGPWHWVDPSNDVPVRKPGYGEDEEIGRVSLRTVDDEFRKTSWGSFLPGFILDEVEYEQDTAADAVFIAHSREDIDWLLARVDELEEQIAKQK